jgi:cytochrome c oxidase subunit 2
MASLRAGRAVEKGRGGNEVQVEITGHQWWWEIRYPGKRPDETAITANELHVPVGRTVRVTLSSADVIHSFWAPELNGKTDLIPGRSAAQTFRIERAGIYPGRCAEFCGYQHAHMAFLVIAEPEEKFDAWLAAQRSPATDPASPPEERGRAVFVGYRCALCHTVRGTGAGGTNGPDLTHFGSRRTIAAATLDNAVGPLGGWIADPQGIKPGNHMPPSGLPASDLLALIAYLRSLR